MLLKITVHTLFKMLAKGINLSKQILTKSLKNQENYLSPIMHYKNVLQFKNISVGLGPNLTEDR